MIVSKPDRQQWKEFVDKHPKGSIFHTPQMWQVFKEAKRHQPTVLAAIDRSGDIVALLTSVRIQSLPNPLGPISSRSIFYAEPICREDSDGVNGLRELILEHDRLQQSNVLFSEVRPLWPSSSEKSALHECGYEYERYLNYIIDLAPATDDLWANVSSSCRANIRHGQKSGTHVSVMNTPKGIEVLYKTLQKTYERAKVPLAHKSMFDAALKILAPERMLDVYVTSVNDENMGAGAVLRYKRVAYEWYAGAERLKPFYPAECGTWGRVKAAKENGFNSYDFGGAGSPFVSYGVRDYKARFGGTLVDYGRYRKVYSGWKLRVAESAYEIVRKSAYSRIFNRIPNEHERPIQ